MVTSTPALPRWDMSPIFPGLDSPEYKQGFQSIKDEINNLTALFDRYNISRHDPAPLDAAIVAQFEEVITGWNDFLTQYRTMSAYISCILATDTRDNLTQSRI